MTISSTTRTSSYTGNGATSTYAYTPWRIMDQTHLKVSVQSPTTFLWTTLTLTTDYTVTGVGNGTGGTAVLVDASQAWLTSGFLTTSWVIQLERVVPNTQLTNVREEGPFKPEIHEDEYDLLVSADQQAKADTDRSLKLPVGETPSVTLTTLPSVTDRASKGLGFDASGNPTALTFSTVGAPTDAKYVTLQSNASLSQERVLTGTANQITITDNGAGSTVVVSAPQNIHPAATPTFGGMTLNGGFGLIGGNANISTGDVILTSGSVEIQGGVQKFGVLPSTTGAIRLSNNLAIAIRNAANGANLNIATVNASDQMTVGAAGLTSLGFNVTGPFFAAAAALLGFTPTSPTQITANQNDYVATGTWTRLNTDASRNITGIVAGYDGQIRWISNVGAQDIVLTNQDAASAAANRIITGTGANLTLATDKSIMTIYDATTARWRIFKNA